MTPSTTRSRSSPPTVLGVKPKSGWAAAVLLGGTRDAPVVLEVCRLELADPGTPASIQPYHASPGTAQTDRRKLDRLLKLVEGCAQRNTDLLLRRLDDAGRKPARAAVVATSATDPASITNPHIRIHALEGRLFRQVAADALRAGGLECTITLEAELRAAAPAELKCSAMGLTRKLAELKPREGPWRSDQKAAALAAWLLLAATS